MERKNIIKYALIAYAMYYIINKSTTHTARTTVTDFLGNIGVDTSIPSMKHIAVLVLALVYMLKDTELAKPILESLGIRKMMKPSPPIQPSMPMPMQQQPANMPMQQQPAKIPMQQQPAAQMQQTPPAAAQVQQTPSGAVQMQAQSSSPQNGASSNDSLSAAFKQQIN